MAATRTIGQMQAFNPANESVTAYLERFQLFVTANVIEDDKLVPTLLTVVGSDHYSLLRGHVSPQLLTTIWWLFSRNTMIPSLSLSPSASIFIEGTKVQVNLSVTIWPTLDASPVAANLALSSKKR